MTSTRGPGSADKLKLPAGWPRTVEAIVWSQVDGAWWRIDGGPSLAAMQWSAMQRLAFALRRNPAARIVATDRHGDPECAEEIPLVAVREAMCTECGWGGDELQAQSGCPGCQRNGVIFFDAEG